MELINFLIQLDCVGEQETKKSSVNLIVNQEGEELISKHDNYAVLHNCSIRNIVSKSGVWNHYFKIRTGNEENGVVVKCKVQHPFKITKVKD